MRTIRHCLLVSSLMIVMGKATAAELETFGPIKFAKRDLAYASYVLGTQGDDPATWRAMTVSPNYQCPQDLARGSNSREPGEDCFHDVLYTTRYHRIHCDDGRSYVVRSGFGISLTSPTAGTRFRWAEHYTCEPCDHATALARGDADRPIDFDHIAKD